MGATSALVIIRLADGMLVYINERSLAELYVKAHCDAGGVSSNGDCISQRLAVIEASLRVQHELAYDGKPLPCLHHAVQALRILNRASGEAKHGFADCRGHEPVFSPGSCSPPDLERNGLANSAPSADGSPLHDNATSDAAFPAVCGQDAPPPHDRDTSDDVHGATSEVEEAAGDMDDPFAMMSGMGSEQVYKVTLVAAVPAVSGHDGPPPHDKDTSDAGDPKESMSRDTSSASAETEVELAQAHNSLQVSRPYAPEQENRAAMQGETPTETMTSRRQGEGSSSSYEHHNEAGGISKSIDYDQESIANCASPTDAGPSWKNAGKRRRKGQKQTTPGRGKGLHSKTAVEPEHDPTMWEEWIERLSEGHNLSPDKLYRLSMLRRLLASGNYSGLARLRANGFAEWFACYEDDGGVVLDDVGGS